MNDAINAKLNEMEERNIPVGASHLIAALRRTLEDLKRFKGYYYPSYEADECVRDIAKILGCKQ